MYPIILHLHATTAVISISLFVTRFIGLQTQSSFMQKNWVRYLPHVNDSCLLLLGIILVILTKYYPFTKANLWLSEKLGFLIAYIIFGYIAIKGNSLKSIVRYSSFILALLCFISIIYLVKTKNPF